MKNGEGNGAAALRHVRTIEFPAEGPFVSHGEPAPDGFAEVGWDQNTRFPAYRVDHGDGAEFVPFTPLVQFAPRDFAGDYYVDEFSDAAIKARWRSARTDARIRERVMGKLARNAPPHEFRATGLLNPRGRIDANGEVAVGATQQSP